jgi:putative transcriptional regulator
MAMSSREPLFERLKTGLKEGIAHTRGELTLKSVELPEAPPEIDAKTLAAIREQAGMSQAVFARLFHVSPKTVQSWEQGTRKPSMIALRMIHIFTEQPAAVCKVAGLPIVRLGGFRIESFGKGKRRIVVNRQNGQAKKMKTA